MLGYVRLAWAARIKWLPDLACLLRLLVSRVCQRVEAAVEASLTHTNNFMTLRNCDMDGCITMQRTGNRALGVEWWRLNRAELYL